MKIAEMNQCLEAMRKCYKFEDEKTEIKLGSIYDCGNGKTVEICTKDANGTEIIMVKRVTENDA